MVAHKSCVQKYVTDTFIHVSKVVSQSNGNIPELMFCGGQHSENHM